MSDQSRPAEPVLDDDDLAGDDLPADDMADDAPDLARLDYDALLLEEKDVLDPDELDAGEGDEEGDEDDADAVIGEDDDNPFGESDSALPDDEAEAAMRDEMSGTGIHFEPDDGTDEDADDA